MASVAIERACGIETIPHLTPRDMAIAGLESLLLGAHAEGVRNILAVTGDPPEEGDYPGARGVYEVDAIGLTRLIAGLNRGEDYHGRAIDAPTSFFTGVAVNPSADDLERRAASLRAEARGGRSVRDDAGALRPRLPRRLPRPLRRRLPDPAARRHLADAEPSARGPRPQRGSRDRHPGGDAAASARRPARTPPRSARGSRATCSPSRARRRRASTSWRRSSSRSASSTC